MKITITGSLGNIGKPLTTILTASGHEVTVVSSSADRTLEIENLNAKAAIGSVSDADFLTEAMRGADAVFAMTPPNLGGSNILANTINAGKALATAIAASGVKRVVMLSSIGAEHANGTGPIAGLHAIEALYSTLENVSLTYLRAGYFYTNYFNDVPLIKGMGIIGANYPASTTIPLVHPADIASAAAEELTNAKTGTDTRLIVSQVLSAQEIASILGAAIAKPELPWVEFTDEQSFDGMKQAGLPEEMAMLYTEMGTAIRKGLLSEEFEKQGAPTQGQTKFEDFAKTFASSF
ncbi:NAD(P)H-binding protein [Pedobacter sp. AW1-32]|uniref:NmrA family NAD(P)-binding protein n=1 Tax=Pedobacter sp. AW1-32 TaxID=3383026 RepID=UPI003FEEE396